MKVNVTKNYRMFARSADNRALVPDKHKRLRDSMREYGFLPEFPIVCYRDSDKHLIVKDGQHRLAIAEQLELPVHWVEESTPWDVALVNSTAVSWRPLDYAQRAAAQGNKHYQEALDFMSAHDLPIGLAFALLAGVTSFSNTKRQFYTGEFTVKDREWADAVASIYRPFATASRHCRSARFVEACMAVCRVNGFDPQRLLRKMQGCRDKLVSYSTRDAYLEMLEDIYNFRATKLVALKNEAIMAMRNRSAAKPNHKSNGKA